MVTTVIVSAKGACRRGHKRIRFNAQMRTVPSAIAANVEKKIVHPSFKWFLQLHPSSNDTGSHPLLTYKAEVPAYFHRKMRCLETTICRHPAASNAQMTGT